MGGGAEPAGVEAVTPAFVAVERFNPSDPSWAKFVEWSGLTQLDELISLDSMLCAPVLKKMEDGYWSKTIHQDCFGPFFTDLSYLERATAAIADKQILCVLRNPCSSAEIPSQIDRFALSGFDLLEAQTMISALSNCGGFPDVFANSELSRCGLIERHERALAIQRDLLLKHPEESHADCDIWAIYSESGR